jgi:hypothetical protein
MNNTRLETETYIVLRYGSPRRSYEYISKLPTKFLYEYEYAIVNKGKEIWHPELFNIKTPIVIMEDLVEYYSKHFKKINKIKKKNKKNKKSR